MKKVGDSISSRLRSDKQLEGSPATSAEKSGQSSSDSFRHLDQDKALSIPAQIPASGSPRLSPPKILSFEAIKTIKNFLDRIDKNLPEQIQLFIEGKPIHLPDLPTTPDVKKFFDASLSADERKVIHSDLLLGNDECNGTYEISRWISKVISKVLDAGAEERIATLTELGISHSLHDEVITSLSRLPKPLIRLQKIRDYSRFYLLSTRYNKIKNYAWESYARTVSLSILSDITHNNLTMIPSDYRLDLGGINNMPFTQQDFSSKDIQIYATLFIILRPMGSKASVY